MLTEIEKKTFFPIPRTYFCVRQMGRLGLFTVNFLPPNTAAPGFEPTPTPGWDL